MNVRESDTPIPFGSRWGPEKREKKISTIKPSVCRKQEVTYYDGAKEVFRPVNKANDLSDFEIEECKEAFSTFDTTGAGQISTDHLGQLLKIMGHSPTPDEIKNILEEVDEDGTGILHFREFLHIMASLSGDDDKDIREAFLLMDKENRGDIGADELQTIMARLGHALTEDEILSMIREVDTTGNDRVSYEEFAAMMKKTA